MTINTGPEPTVKERMAALIEEHKDKIPGWARWVAVDVDGLYAYEHKPKIIGIDKHIFGPSSEKIWPLAESIAVGDFLLEHWSETLTELPTVKRELIVQDDPVAHATAVYDQQKMIDRDERELSPAEQQHLQNLVDQAVKSLDNSPKPLTVPSICLQDHGFQMMLGGKHGGRHD